MISYDIIYYCFPIVPLSTEQSTLSRTLSIVLSTIRTTISRTLFIILTEASFAYKYPSPSPHFHPSSRINSNNSHTNSSNLQKSTNADQTKPKTKKKHTIQNKDAFTQQHPCGFGHRSLHHSPWTHDHGDTPTLRKS